MFSFQIKMHYRHRRRKITRSYSDYSEETLHKALKAINDSSSSLNEASKQFQISKSTFSRKSRKLNSRFRGRPRALSLKEATQLSEAVRTFDNCGFLLYRKDIAHR